MQLHIEGGESSLVAGDAQHDDGDGQLDDGHGHRPLDDGDGLTIMVNDVCVWSGIVA